MSRRFLSAIALSVLASACAESAELGELYRAPSIPNAVDGVVFEAGNWTPHLAAGAEGSSWGNHRAVVRVADPAQPTVRVTIPWRRRDSSPSTKNIVVVDATSEELVTNAFPLRVENVSGEVVFQPNERSSTYHIYYLPWTSTGGYYPSVTYPSGAQTADPVWENDTRSRVADLPEAETTHIQSVNDFHSFYPMEVIASETEESAFWDRVGGGWAIVPEHRDRPIRMRRHLPRHWTLAGTPTSQLTSQALRGEYFTFQIGVVAGTDSLSQVSVSFEGFETAATQSLTCFNCGGIDENGVSFTTSISVATGEVQPLWIGLQVPEDQSPGSITGDIVVATRDYGEKRVRLALEVSNRLARNSGFDEPALMSRLAWLNSTVGTDPDFIIDPFEPVSIEGKTLSILGRQVVLDGSGLPRAIGSAFTPELTSLADTFEPVLAGPLDLRVTANTREGASNPVDFTSEPFDVVQHSRARAEWVVDRQSTSLAMRVEGALEYEGMLDYRITIRALADVDIADVSLPVSLVPGAAEYMLGLGRRGSKRPDVVDWKWKVENHQEGVWLGSVHKGLQYVLRDDSYVRPLNTNFYQNQPLRMPVSWFNGGQGGIRIEASDSVVTALNYSGPRRMSVGDSLQFNVRFLLTPFKPLDTGTHFRTRFVHKYVPVDSVQAWGGTVVNIHHANEINPYINYPFFNLEQQTAYIEEAHQKGIKVKLYNTIRELSYRAHELFAFRSLGDEILNDGEGGGHSWMQEHLEDEYHSAWHAWRVDDAAMLNKGTSRWTNYYIEGLNWLAAHQEIDGLYLDDIAFSRETVKRMVSVLHQHRDEVVIDLHSANQFNPRDGHINSAFLYMEHFPFISRLWFGEYFEYERDPDYWMTEVSGLPFGLMGEMLQDGGHPYRGLLYGMTARLYGDVDPRPVWALMDDFGIEDSRMLGYWLADTPVRSDHEQVRATSYVTPDGVLIALASWSERDQVVSLSLDREVLGLDAESQAVAPAVDGLQARSNVDLAAVQVPANQGLFIWIR